MNPDNDNGLGGAGDSLEVEQAGAFLRANVWFKIGLMRAQSKQVGEWARAVLPSELATCGNALHLILQVAVANLPLIEHLMRADGGLPGTWSGMIDHEHVAEQRARNVKLGLN